MPQIQNVQAKAVASVAYLTLRRKDNIEPSTEKVMPEAEGLMGTIWYLIKTIFGMDERRRRVESQRLAMIPEVEVLREKTAQTVNRLQGTTDGEGVAVDIDGEKSMMNVTGDNDVTYQALVLYNQMAWKHLL